MATLTATRHSTISPWRSTAQRGVVLGLVVLFIALVGLVGAFAKKDLVYEVISVGQFLLLISGFIGGYITGQRSEHLGIAARVLHGTMVAVISGVIVALFLLLATTVDFRDILVNSNRDLFAVLQFKQEAPLSGAIVLVVVFAVTGLAGSLLSLPPQRWRAPIMTGLLVVLLIGLLADLLDVLLVSGPFKPLAEFLFPRKGISVPGALALFVVSAIVSTIWPFFGQVTTPARKWINSPGRKPVKFTLIVAVLVPLIIVLPWVLQLYLSDVMTNVGIYILMGLGLNIVVGFAGLLDLGYVAFFAIGAYVMGLLTSPDSSLALSLTFWEALPISMVVAGTFGVLLGIPVLRMRGDYLAIVTLGFGEIIRILATSEVLLPVIGGPQGILGIPKPALFGLVFKDAQYIFYIVVVCALIALYVSWRLSDSRIGRAWVAIREDEDVAEAMGINLVSYKLLAFAIGATFSGMAGGIFAAKLGSIFPHSFNLLISINVLSLIIVGGMGSLPGVFIGALVLVGLPELLREFAEYRLLMYGAALVGMMLIKPEGFVPAQQRKRELAQEDVFPEELEEISAPAVAEEVAS